MKKFPLIMILATMLVACGPSREQRIEEIEDFEDSIFESAIAADPNTADELTKLYTAFADKYPDDTLAPQYLLKAAESQSNVIHTEKAIALFDRIINNYPDFEEIPICYFLKGNAYELNSQYDEAKAAYQTFVEKYPDHYLADQTRYVISHVGMSPEEMLADILANASDTIIAQ
ncbi:MAG: tetratricopeptide repeat protein [Bacteroidales bacterium]|nr:tetratricopeptide repeat protein [Bacteroidales bacterium]